MKSKSGKSSKKIEEIIKKEKQHAAIIDWFHNYYCSHFERVYEKNETDSKDEAE